MKQLREQADREAVELLELALEQAGYSRKAREFARQEPWVIRVLQDDKFPDNEPLRGHPEPHEWQEVGYHKFACSVEGCSEVVLIRPATEPTDNEGDGG